jgi:hypothetical protein
MKRQVWIILGVFLLIGGFTFWIIRQQNQPVSYKYPDRDFSTPKIDEVHRIFLANKKGDIIDLKKQKDDVWLLNDKYEAYFNTVDVLLRTLKNLRVKYIPPRVAEEHIIRSLASNGIKVELFDKQGKSLKTFYVGGNTADDLGTAFIMEGYDQPYVLYVPGHHGGIRSRFDLKETNLISRWIFTEKMEDIVAASIDYPAARNQSFQLTRTGGRYQVKPFYDITPEIRGEVMPSAVEAFLASFEKLGAEAVINESVSKDSVLALVPFCNIRLELKDGTEKTLAMYPVIDMISEDVSKIDNPQYDTFVERYFAYSNNGHFYMTQQYIFGKVFWGYEHFFDPAGKRSALID